MFLRGLPSNSFRRASVQRYTRFSIHGLSITADNSRHTVDESRVLRQLSDVLPLSVGKSIAVNPPSKQLAVREVDDFLPPEDKLRGVFLQKLRGEASIHRALSSVGAELNAEVFARVVNRGNLCGESILNFFNWAIQQQPDLFRNIGTYNVVLKALGRRKFFVHMMGILTELKDKGISPNSVTLSIVMHSFLRANHVTKAVKFFGELEEYGLQCDEETLTVALQCLARAHVGAACSLLNKMKEKVQCGRSMYNIIIAGWSKFGRIAEVEKFLKVMMDNGVEPNHVTYSSVIMSFGKAGRVEDAVKIFNHLEEKGNPISVEVYNGMIFSYTAIDDTDEALKYYHMMLRSSIEPNLDTYRGLIRHCLKIKRVADALEIFDEMLGRGVVPPTGTVTEFIEPLCWYGPPHGAYTVYKKARKAGCRISLAAYKLLLMKLSRFGKYGMLLNIWDEMQESGYSSDMQVYEYIINSLCNTGQLETAVQLVEECIAKGYFPGKIVCSKLSNKLMDANKVEVAYRLFLKLRNVRVNANARRSWRARGWHF